MCTVSIDNDEHLYMTQEDETSDLPPNSVCIKCQNAATFTLQKRNAYCTSCVVQSIKHKFRSTLGKSKLIKRDQRVLVAYSGGHCSSVLLHLLHEGLSDVSHKKLKFSAIILFVKGAHGFDDADDLEDMNKTEVERYGFEFHCCHLSDAMAETDHSKLYDNDDKCQSFLKSINSDTSKIDILERIRNQLIVSYAEKMGCQFVFVADHSPKLAIKLLSDTCLGRGSQLSYNGFIDSRYDNVTLLRPMKDITQEELEIYTICHKIFVPTISSSRGNRAVIRERSTKSIQCTISDFVNDLQKNYPATISTIQKTGEKLGTACNSQERTNICVMCQSDMDTDASESSAVKSTIFSKKVSSLGPANLGDAREVQEASESSCDRNGECRCKTEASPSRKEIESCLCYGCIRTLDDVEDITELPARVLSDVRRKATLDKIHDEIKDFLL